MKLSSWENLALDNIKYSAKAVINNDQDMIDKVIETEHKVDLYEKYLTEYLIKGKQSVDNRRTASYD